MRRLKQFDRPLGGESPWLWAVRGEEPWRRPGALIRNMARNKLGSGKCLHRKRNMPECFRSCQSDQPRHKATGSHYCYHDVVRRGATMISLLQFPVRKQEPDPKSDMAGAGHRTIVKHPCLIFYSSCVTYRDLQRQEKELDPMHTTNLDAVKAPSYLVSCNITRKLSSMRPTHPPYYMPKLHLLPSFTSMSLPPCREATSAHSLFVLFFDMCSSPGYQ